MSSGWLTVPSSASPLRPRWTWSVLALQMGTCTLLSTFGSTQFWHLPVQDMVSQAFGSVLNMVGVGLADGCGVSSSAAPSAMSSVCRTRASHLLKKPSHSSLPFPLHPGRTYLCHVSSGSMGHYGACSPSCPWPEFVECCKLPCTCSHLLWEECAQPRPPRALGHCSSFQTS